MSLEEIYFITQIGVGIAVIVSIIFVGLELRQNSFLMRKSLGNDRRQHLNWLFQTICTDNDFRDFHRKIDTDYDNLNEDEKYRAMWLGVSSLRPMFDELVDYFEGRLSKDEWINLESGLKMVAKTRWNCELAYQQFLKDHYPENVQQYWESLPKA